MSKADSPTTLIRSRRAVLAGIASAAALPIAAAIPTTAPAMPDFEQSPPTFPDLAPHPDVELFAATDRYLAALSQYSASIRAFGEVEFIEPRARGYVSKERAYRRAMKHFGKMERDLESIRAKTLDGLIAKARALEVDRGVAPSLPNSIVEDLLGMAPSREVKLPAKRPLPADEKLVALGAKFEPLLREYFDARMKWAPLMSDAQAKRFAKYPLEIDGKRNDAAYDGGSKSKAHIFLTKMLEENGSDAADARASVVKNKLYRLAKSINEASATSIHGLRAKVLVALFEAIPPRSSGPELTLDDEVAATALMRDAAAAVGLSPLVDHMDEKLATA